MAKVLIQPCSFEPSAIEATERALAMLPGGGTFVRDEDGSFALEDGKLVLECSNPGFVIFAAVQQGYVLSATPGAES